MQIYKFIARNLKWFLIVACILIFQVIASSIANADALSEAIANQNSLETTGAISGGNAHGTNPADETLTVKQKDFDSSIGPRTMKEVVRKISDSLKNLENSSAIANLSDSILTMLVALLLAWALVKSMFSGGFNQFIEAGIHTFLMWGIAYAMLNVGGIQGITQFIDSLASIFSGGNMSNLNDALGTTIDKTFGSLSSVLSMPSGNTNYKGTDEFDWVPLLIVEIVQLAAKVITGFLIVLAFIIYACNIVLSFASIILAKAFAGVMIPFILLPSTAFIFNGWLKFFISALLVKCVGAFFIKLCDSIINSIQTVAQSVYLSPDIDGLSLVTANFVVYVCLVGMAGLTAYLMTMVPSIANGLMSGSSVGSGFKGVGVLTNGVAIRGGHRAADATARAAGKTLKWANDQTQAGAKAVGRYVDTLIKNRGNGNPPAGSSGHAGRGGTSRQPPSVGGFVPSGGAPGGNSASSLVGRSGNVIPMGRRSRARGGPPAGGGSPAGGASPAGAGSTAGGGSPAGSGASPPGTSAQGTPSNSSTGTP